MNTKEKTMPPIIPEEIISRKIFIIRGQKIMLDIDLAELYEVSTKVLNQAVKRNLSRFPDDFMFQLTVEEKDKVVTDCDHLSKLKFSYQLPYAFTEHGVAMLSAILNSARAVAMSIFIVRTFIKIRELLSTNKDLTVKIDELERKQIKQGENILTISSVLKQLITKQPHRKVRLSKKAKIGFNTTD